MEDLVAVGVADPGDERLVAQQVLELARMAADPLAPDVQGQRRVVGIGTLLRLRPDPGSVDRRRPGGGRSCPSGSGRDSGSRPGHRRPAARRRHASSRRRRPGHRARGPKPRTTAVLVGSLSPGRRQLEAAGQHRVGGDLVALEVDQQELAAPPDRRRRSGRPGRPARPACRAPRAGRAPPRTAPDDRRWQRGGRRRPRSDRAIRARRGDCSPEKACARLSRPQGARISTSDIEPIRRTKERTAELDHHGPPERFGHGLSVAQAVRDSRAQIHNQE